MTPRRFLQIALVCLCAAAPLSQKARAQPAAPSDQTPSAAPNENKPGDVVVVPDSFKSPRAALFTFLEAMGRATDAGLYSRRHADAIAEAVACFDVPAASREASAEAATLLLGVFNRIGEIFPYELPGAEQSENLTTFTYFPRSSPRQQPLIDAAPDARITLVRTDTGAWKFSQKTIEGLADFYRRVERLPVVYGADESKLSLALRIRRLAPGALRSGQVLNIEYWQWIGMAMLVFLAVVFDFLVQTILSAFASGMLKRRGGEVDRESVAKFVRPFGLLVAAGFTLASIWLLGLPSQAMIVLLAAIRFVLMVSGVWAAFRIADMLAELAITKAATTQTKFDDLLIPLIRKTAKIVIFALGLIYIANSLHINIVPLVTGLGIGGLAVAFAAKDTIENFFGSIAVILDRPFEVGDWIVSGDVEGTVEELGFRSTRVRTFYNSLVTIPNASLVRATVDNYGRRKHRRVKTMLSLTYDTPPEKIEAFCEGVRELVRLHPYTRKDYYHIYFNQFAAASLDVLLYVFLDCPDWATELREKQRLFMDILRLADRLGVEFAFPTQTIHLHQESGDGEHAPAPRPGASAESDALRRGRAEAHALTSSAPWRSATPAPVVVESRPTFDDVSSGEDDGE